MMQDINWYVWKLSKSDEYLGLTLYPNDCRYSVPNDFGVGFHQCQRLPKVTIDGYGFCTQHAKIIEKHKKRTSK